MEEIFFAVASSCCEGQNIKLECTGQHLIVDFEHHFLHQAACCSRCKSHFLRSALRPRKCSAHADKQATSQLCFCNHVPVVSIKVPYLSIVITPQHELFWYCTAVAYGTTCPTESSERCKSAYIYHTTTSIKRRNRYDASTAVPRTEYSSRAYEYYVCV